MKISKAQIKSIIMQEVKNIMEGTKKGDHDKTKDASGQSGQDAYGDREGNEDKTKDADGRRGQKSDGAARAGGEKKDGEKAYRKKPKNRKDSVKEDYDYTEEKHDDEDADHLERIRDDINRHIDALRDQHRRVKDYEDRKDD